jgi:hemolysin activation/secretion protein
MKSRFLWIQGSLIPLSFLTGLGILWLSPAVAQTSAPVDPPATPAPPEPNLPIEPVSQVLIKEIRVVGSTLFTPQQLKSIVSSYEGKELKVDDLKALLNAITQLYIQITQLITES